MPAGWTIIFWGNKGTYRFTQKDTKGIIVLRIDPFALQDDLNKVHFMNISRIISLLFRYGILAFLGFCIASLWKICGVDAYNTWGMFYAVWLPLLYALFSTGYMLVAEYLPRYAPFSETQDAFHSRLEGFLRYDDYTYLAPLGFLVFEIASPYMEREFFWFGVFYLLLIIVKTTIFLLLFSGHIRQIDSSLERGQDVRVPIKVTVLVVAFCVYAMISGFHIQRATTTGDEPHYLLITHSLWHDHDTNLYNNYNNRDFESFFWYDLQPSWGDVNPKDETKVYSYRHKGGFPHTLIPGYVLGGRLGATLQMNLIAALLMLQVFLLSYEVFGSLKASFLTWLCVAFTVPMMIYMGQIYPETLAALLTIWGVRQIRQLRLEDSFSTTRFWPSVVFIGLTLIALVLLKTRYVPVAGTLVLFLLYQIVASRMGGKLNKRMLVNILLVLVCVTIAALLADTCLLGGKLWDRLNDREYMVWILSTHNPVKGFLGLLFDQEYGLLFYTPVYLLALVGIGLLPRKTLKTTLPLFGIFTLNYLVLAVWPLWHAAPTPPGRYLLPVLPLLGIFLTPFLGAFQCGQDARVPMSTLQRMVFGVCVIWSALAAWMMTLNPQWRYNWADGTNNILEMLSWRLSLNLTDIFPSWIRMTPLTPVLTGLVILLIGGLIFLFRREIASSQPFLARLATTEQTVVVTLVLVMGLLLGGFLLAKLLPASVLEAEDRLDFQAVGGERIPESLDPWNNQIYLREWAYFGWKLDPGDSLRSRPRLLRLLPSLTGDNNEWELHIYARAEKHKDSQAFPVMRILLDGREIGLVTVSSTDWNIYPLTFHAAETRPLLELTCQHPSRSQRALIVDKVRFE